MINHDKQRFILPTYSDAALLSGSQGTFFE